eukprot:gnl/TRDRNA2_/TRDRNA2_39544_c0_seq1.p1 gnl/TRDRNA2_/TRDRNA2_39544_c0~~gnl/TRDRNA2_/TRDRNA2_39544_c0_seq1.p1  ORF type:complete len:175 (+),score=39.01 gnl/TRDRNA2_/TRDRNA2_39544_c0_seq1:172-696(+)
MPPVQLVLLRHGTPVPEEEDPARPLSEQGRTEAAQTSKGLALYLGTPTESDVQILHSGKARAQQTAEAVKDSLVAAGWASCVCEATKGLDPKDDAGAAAELVSNISSPVLVLVGHLPHMGLLSARLIGEPAAAGRLGGCFAAAGGLVLRPLEGSWKEARQIEPGATWWEQVGTQ